MAILNFIFLICFIITLKRLTNILRTRYYDFYQIAKKRLFVSNGIIIFAILLKIGWMIYDAEAGIGVEGIRFIVNLCLIIITSYIVPCVAIIIKLWMSLNNIK